MKGRREEEGKNTRKERYPQHIFLPSPLSPPLSQAAKVRGMALVSPRAPLISSGRALLSQCLSPSPRLSLPSFPLTPPITPPHSHSPFHSSTCFSHSCLFSQPHSPFSPLPVSPHFPLPLPRPELYSYLLMFTIIFFPSHTELCLFPSFLSQFSPFFSLYLHFPLPPLIPNLSSSLLLSNPFFPFTQS